MPPRRVIGVDAGGTKLLGGVVDEQLVVHHRVHRIWRGADRQETLDIFVEAVEEIRAAAPDVDAVGFGLPALVHQEAGTSAWSTHLPLEGVPFRDLMSERLGLPVHVDNDANVALLAEHRHGAAAGRRHAAMVLLGTGIGGGLLFDGRIYRGATGVGAELGHIVVDLHGPDCQGACPGRGCLEVLASGGAIGREAERVAAERPDSELGRRLAAGAEITGAIATELAHEGDEAARDVLAEVGRRLGAGLVSLVNALNPEMIVIGGGAVAAGDLLIDPAREVVAERALPPARDIVQIVSAHFGAESGMLGSALLAFDGGVS
jgi:glucokinase